MRQRCEMASDDSHEDHLPVESPTGLGDNETTSLLQNEHKHAIDGAEPIRTYWWRWTTLGVYVLNLALFNTIWLTFAPISDVIKCYYNVTNFWVNSLSLVTMVVYILLMFPSAWCLERLGLRTTVIIASSSTVVGAALRLAGTSSRLFGVLLTGQTIASINNGLIWGAPPLFSDVWFPVSERATATAIGAAVAPQLGILLAFALSPVIVGRNDTGIVCNNTEVPRDTLHFWEWSETIYGQLSYYLLGQTIFSLVVLLLTYLAFPSAPPTPPSRSRQLCEASHDDVHSFASSLAKFLKNKHFVGFLFVAGINLATSLSILSLINQIIIPRFPGKEEQIAYLGITSCGAAIVVMIVIGRLLDTTKAFYGISVTSYIASALSLALFGAMILYQPYFWVLYIGIALVGGSMTAYLAVAYEYAVEMTYPLPEGTAAGLLNLSAMALAIVMIASLGQFVKGHHQVVIWIVAGLVALGAVIAIFIRPKLRRSEIDKPKLEHVGYVQRA